MRKRRAGKKKNRFNKQERNNRREGDKVKTREHSHNLSN